MSLKQRLGACWLVVWLVKIDTTGGNPKPNRKGGWTKKNVTYWVNYNSRIARHGRNIMKYHEISAWCILTVPIQSIHGNSAYSHGNSVKNPATYHLIFVQRKKTFSKFQIHQTKSANLWQSLTFFLKPLLQNSASAIDWYPFLAIALLSRRHLLGLFPGFQCFPQVVPASLFYYPQSKKEVHRNQDVPKDVQRK